MTGAPGPDLPRRSGAYRLGVFGGQFDPPHLGHRAVIEAVRETLELDRILVVPTGMPPHRPASERDARLRLDLAVRAFADLEHVAVSDLEVDSGSADEPSYTVDTLEELESLPAGLGYADLDVELTLIVGADQLVRFTTWHRWRRILELARLAVVVRRPVDRAEVLQAVAALTHAGGRITMVEMPEVPISSTLVRERARAGTREKIAGLVEESILDDVVSLYNGVV